MVGGEKKGRKINSLCACVCERERGERRDRCLRCKNYPACFACTFRLRKCSAWAKKKKALFKNRLKQARAAPAAVSEHSGGSSDQRAHENIQRRMVITEALGRAVNHTEV